LLHAVLRGRTDAVRLLLERRASVNIACKHDWIPLMADAWEGHTDIVKLLLKHGADVNALSSARQSVLMLAESEGMVAPERALNRPFQHGRTDAMRGCLGV
jgi:ankyrin repeat protein